MFFFSLLSVCSSLSASVLVPLNTRDQDSKTAETGCSQPSILPDPLQFADARLLYSSIAKCACKSTGTPPFHSPIKPRNRPRQPLVCARGAWVYASALTFWTYGRLCEYTVPASQNSSSPNRLSLAYRVLNTKYSVLAPRSQYIRTNHISNRQSPETHSPFPPT